jgi:uncharacterized protein YozE (UPF0346 family)
MSQSPRKPTFTQWLETQRGRRHPVGHFADDVERDETWPPTETLEGYTEYLEDVGAASCALRAFQEAWHEWEAEAV